MHCEECKAEITIEVITGEDYTFEVSIPQCICGYQETDPFKKFS